MRINASGNLASRSRLGSQPLDRPKPPLETVFPDPAGGWWWILSPHSINEAVDQGFIRIGWAQLKTGHRSWTDPQYLHGIFLARPSSPSLKAQGNMAFIAFLDTPRPPRGRKKEGLDKSRYSMEMLPGDRSKFKLQFLNK